MKRVKLYHPDSTEPIEVYDTQVPSLEERGWSTEKQRKRKKPIKPSTENDQPAAE